MIINLVQLQCPALTSASDQASEQFVDDNNGQNVSAAAIIYCYKLQLFSAVWSRYTALSGSRLEAGGDGGQVEIYTIQHKYTGITRYVDNSCGAGCCTVK